MVHHCPTCHKVCTTRCVKKEHVYECPVHLEYYKPGGTCDSCNDAAVRAANEESRKKAEARGEKVKKKHWDLENLPRSLGLLGSC
ncbi:hypothetical protein BDW69DRAFT_188456 [Aspergillus filifer]